MLQVARASSASTVRRVLVLQAQTVMIVMAVVAVERVATMFRSRQAFHVMVALAEQVVFLVVAVARAVLHTTDLEALERVRQVLGARVVMHAS